MKNILIAATALAGLFSGSIAQNCQAGIEYCGSIADRQAVYSVVIAQWYHDVYKKVTPSGYENNLYRCLPTGALDYVKVCAFGCNATALGEDDRCLSKGPGIMSEEAERKWPEKPVFRVAQDLRV